MQGGHNGSKQSRAKRKQRQKNREEFHEQRRAQIRQLNVLFLECDEDKTGFLTDTELSNFLSSCNAIMDEGEMKEHELEHAVKFVLKAADGDNDGGIAFEELVPAFQAFNNWTMQKDSMRSMVMELMGKHDDDASGTLDRAELLVLVTELNFGKQIKEAVFEKIWSSADNDGNGTVDLDELAPALSKWDQGDFEVKKKSKYSYSEIEDLVEGEDGQKEKVNCCVVS